MPDHVVIYRTGRLHELELACNALKESGVPHFKQQETSSGLKLAMPFAPFMGPGTFWNIPVPVSAKEAAEKILEELPIDFTTNPDLWHFDPKTPVKKSWKLYIIILLGGSAIALAYNVLILLKN